MIQPLVGTIQIDGLVEGPGSAWSPTVEQVEDALRRAGAPPDALRPVIDGGRVSLEPAPQLFPREQFSGDPGEALGLALSLMLEEHAGGMPADWFSSLRVSGYEAKQKRETLISLGEDGVKAVGRDSPWTPPRTESRLQSLLRRWPIGVLLLIAAGVGGWLNRDLLESKWYQIRALYDPLTVEQISLDAGPYAEWVEIELESVEDDLFQLSLSAKSGAPASPEQIDAWIAEEAEGSPRRSALSAFKDGRVNIVFERGETELHSKRVGLDTLISETPRDYRLFFKPLEYGWVESIRLDY